MKNLQLLAILTLLFIVSCGDDDEPALNSVRLSINDLEVMEGDEDNMVSLTLQLDEPAEDVITIALSSMEGTAEEDIDYVGFSSEVVSFQKGESTKDFDLTIKGDPVFELNESFEVVASNPSGPVTLGKSSAVVTIQNDDLPLPLRILVQLKINFDGLISLPPNSEASAFVNFGQPPNVPNADWTIEVAEGEVCKWELETPTASTRILFPENAVEFLTTDTISNFLEFITPDTFPSPTIEYQVIAADPFEDVEWKYNLFFLVERDGVQYGPFFIDPKIRIPSSQ
ncbi:MAG: Calx-beta domain-containing protein [Bacteroidota bacterium]